MPTRGDLETIMVWQKSCKSEEREKDEDGTALCVLLPWTSHLLQRNSIYTTELIADACEGGGRGGRGDEDDDNEKAIIFYNLSLKTIWGY